MTASNMPSVWNNIVGAGDYGTPNNITTTVTNSASDADNYSYQVVENYENSTWEEMNVALIKFGADIE
jgi:hypothetical protein